jgi:hypothetical protein
MNSNETYAVLTADIVDSRKVKDFPSARDRRLRPLAQMHTKGHLILSPYAVTAWDEFEGILSDLNYIPDILLDLRRHFYPMRLRIGIGIGVVSNPKRAPVNLFAGGIAFERARAAIKRLNSERSTRSTLILSDDDEFDEIANGIYQLSDALLDRVTAKQWIAINARLGEARQDATAKKLGLNKSLVSRLLRRGSYSELTVTKKLVKTIIAHFWGTRERKSRVARSDG